MAEKNVTRARILVAEDNPVNQKVVRRMLEKLGYRSDVVANGKEVLTALEELPYDLVLMDCQMPVMDGFEATRQIRRTENGTKRPLPIVALTADALTTDLRRCREAGMNDCMTKPVALDRLGEMLERNLRHEPAIMAG